MREMVKGSNVALAALSENAGSVIVSLSWASPTGEGDADVSVLLLDANGKVPSDSDFYFYNNPVAADGSVQLLGKTPTENGDEDRISFDLTAVPPGIDRIVVAASRYDGAGFGELEDLRVTLADGGGENFLRFAIDDADMVSAIIFGELYRRGEEWKFRAVGQGYDTGLAGLATDFGVDIEDDAGAEEALDTTGSSEHADREGGAVRLWDMSAPPPRAMAILSRHPARWPSCEDRSPQRCSRTTTLSWPPPALTASRASCTSATFMT